MAFAGWVAYLAWEHFVERYGIVWKALDLVGAVREGQRPLGLVKSAREYCLVPALEAALVAIILAWPVQAAAVLLGLRMKRAPSPVLAADYDDKPPSPPTTNAQPIHPKVVWGALESAAEALVGAGCGTVGHAVLWAVTFGRWSPHNGREDTAMIAGLLFWAVVGVGLGIVVICQEP